MLKVHETIGDQRIKFAGNITEVADDLQLLYKDTERGRKQVNNMTSSDKCFDTYYSDSNVSVL
jgi:hypothetical protein